MGLADGAAFEREFGKDIWNKKENPLPKYLVRPDDCCIFTLNEENQKYAIDNRFIDIPRYATNAYKIDLLLQCNFFPIQEDQFEYYLDVFHEHYERESKRWKNDGHGGIKEDERYRP